MVNKKMKVYINENTYIYLVILLFLIPLSWICAWFAAVCIHEFCHWLSVKAFGGRVYSLTIGATGANMVCETLTGWKQLICILCGPIGGLLPILIAQYCPRLALCSLILSIYNLLPVMPLDGGRALKILLKEHPIFCLIERIILIVLTIGAVYLAIRLHFGALPLAVITFLWLKNRKSPCKESVCRVQ